MTTLARIVIAIILSLFTSSCINISTGRGKTGNGQVVEANREITEAFTEVHASEGLDVYVLQDDEFNIVVEADENIIDLIGTDIKNGRLKIHCIENIGRATKNIYVFLPEVTALKSSSGADLAVENTLKADRLTLDVSSGADIELDVRASTINASASSGSDIQLSGSAETLHADASSGSDIRAGNLEAKSCKASASSGSDIYVNVSESLIANASSGSDIAYRGNPEKVTKNKSSSGTIRKN